MFGDGTTRAVLVVGRLAFKFARHARGMRCNLYEADIYRRTSEPRRTLLCPGLWRSRRGALLIAKAAAPISGAEAQHLRQTRGFPDWEYVGPGDDECPFEPKASDWG